MNKCKHVSVYLWPTSLELAMILPFFSSSDSSGEGGGVAFGVRCFFCGESSTIALRDDSLGPGAVTSDAGVKAGTP